MLASTSAWVHLQKKYYKINYIYDAHGNTMVLLGSISQGRDCLIHANLNGEILFEHIFEHLTESIGMLSRNEVACIETRKNRISILNLSDYQFTFLSFLFLNEESDQARIEVFSQSKLFAVIETGTLNDNRLRISYYAQPIHQKSTPLAIYESNQNDWTYQWILYKVNDHSKICWLMEKIEDFFVVKCVQLQKNNAVFEILKIKNSLWLNHLEFTILNCWQLRNQISCLTCLMNNREKMIKDMNKIIVIDWKAKEVRLAKFFNNLKFIGILIESFNLGVYCIFRSSLEGLVSTYYGVNTSQEIVAMEYKCKNINKLKISNPRFEDTIFSQFVYDNRECQQFSRRELHFISQKEVTLHFLLDLNEDFDEDLLQDIIEMIQFEQI